VSNLGRWCAIAALALGVLTLATWNAGADTSRAQAPLDGSQLFHTIGCAGCHAGPEPSTGVTPFPPLAEAPQWAADRRPGMTAEEYLAESIRTPGAFLSPEYSGSSTVMPQFQLTASEIDALVEYLLHR